MDPFFTQFLPRVYRQISREQTNDLTWGFLRNIATASQNKLLTKYLLFLADISLKVPFFALFWEH